MRYLRVYETELGGTVDLHPWHGEDELPANTQAAIVLAEYGYIIQLLPSLPESEVQQRQLWLADIPERKNPDIRINNSKIGDIKTPSLQVAIKQSTINRCIYACARQNVSIAVINLMGRVYSVQDIKKGVIGALQPNRNTSIEEVWIITKDKKLFQVARNMVFDESIYDTLKQL